MTSWGKKTLGTTCTVIVAIFFSFAFVKPSATGSEERELFRLLVVKLTFGDAHPITSTSNKIFSNSASLGVSAQCSVQLPAREAGWFRDVPAQHRCWFRAGSGWFWSWRGSPRCSGLGSGMVPRVGCPPPGHLIHVFSGCCNVSYHLAVGDTTWAYFLSAVQFWQEPP